jgi:hypothetical protein
MHLVKVPQGFQTYRQSLYVCFTKNNNFSHQNKYAIGLMYEKVNYIKAKIIKGMAMNPKRLQKTSSAITFIALIFLSSFYTVRVAKSQGVKPQNVFRVAVLSGYEIEAGKRKTNYFTITQLISDSLGRLHTEVDFDRATQLPTSYRWHYFENLQKVKSHFFTTDGLYSIEKYYYSPQNRLISKKIYLTKPGDTLLHMKVEYVYDPTGVLQRSVGYNAKGKKGYIASYLFDSKGTELERKVSGKKLTPPDSIMYLRREPSYDSLGRLVKEIVTTTKKVKPTETTTYGYRYDKDGLLVEKWQYNSKGLLVRRHEFINRSDRRLNQIIEYDGVGNLVDHKAWRYELYKTNDRRHRILE